MGLFSKSKGKDEAPDRWGYDHQRTERERQAQAGRTARRIAERELRRGNVTEARKWAKVAKEYGS